VIRIVARLMTYLVAGLGALIVVYLIVDAETVGEFTRCGNEIADDTAVACAGTMHNFSYCGGFIGIITGSVTIFRQRRKLNASASMPKTGATELS